MKMKKNMYKLLALLTIILFSNCETVDLDQTENPSTLPQSFLDPVYTFNYVQLTLPDFVNSANDFTQRVTRQFAMTGGNTYDNAFSPVSFDSNWRTGYLMLNAIKAMEPKATASGQTYILGASKIIRCYVLMTLVDLYGNIPYSEALQGNANLTPKYDNSADVYAGIYGELNQAISLMQDPRSDIVTGSTAARDLYYGNEAGTGDKTKWITLARTLKLKMLNNSRLVNNFGSYNVASEINSLIAGDDFIDSPSEDFAFKYGTERTTPNSRHPLYNEQYELGGGPYIGNYFLWAVSREKGEPATVASYFDPRTDFYFYRQVTLSTNTYNSQKLPCRYLSKPDHYNDPQYASFYNPSILTPYCTSSDNDGTSFLGRDHGDNSGIPADSGLRTVAGLYPIGGAIGAPLTVAATQSEAGTKGALGQGIMPIMLSSYVNFIKAELILKMGVPGDALSSLLLGIGDSITKTTTFLPDQPGRPDPAVTSAKTTAYRNFITSKFNSANADDKLQIVIKEYYIAAWGNGIEPYNNYRRTGYPSNFQPTIEPVSGAYFSTALYPYVAVNNNPNVPANVRTRKVFWDVAPVTLH